MTATVTAQRQRVARVAGCREKRHESFGPHPAASEGAMNEEHGEFFCLFGRQAGIDFEAFDDLSFYHGNLSG